MRETNEASAETALPATAALYRELYASAARLIAAHPQRFPALEQAIQHIDQHVRGSKAAPVESSALPDYVQRLEQVIVSTRVDAMTLDWARVRFDLNELAAVRAKTKEESK